MTQQPTLPLTKVCRKCGAEKPASEFSASTNTPDGLCSWCRECANKGGRERYSQVKKLEEKLAAGLKGYKDEELLEELFERGYRGELNLNKKITL